MKDFTLEQTPNGTRFVSNTDKAKDWLIDNLDIGMHDPIMDDVGAEILRSMIKRAKLSIDDAEGKVALRTTEI